MNSRNSTSEQLPTEIVDKEISFEKKKVGKVVEDNVKKESNSIQNEPDIENIEKNRGEEDLAKLKKPLDEENLATEEVERQWKTTVIVKEGDTVTELAIRVYGYANDNVLKLIKENNPGIDK